MRRYNSKILLFGEYSVLLGSNALVMPYNRFNGSFEYGRSAISERSNQVLKKLFDYLTKHNSSLNYSLNLEKFKSDVENNLSFKSSIPENYGLGSSGALSAAIYNEYSNTPDKQVISHLKKRKEDLSIIESFFHGKSSGIDALCSFIDSPLLIEKENLTLQNLSNSGPMDVLLIDSLQEGKTKNLISSFKEKWEDQDFIFEFMNEYIPLNNACISSFINKEVSFIENIQDLSAFQFDIFEEMIPEKLHNMWQMGIDNNMYSLKLCGSGGGGFILCFTKQVEKSLAYFNKNIIPALHLKFSS